MKYFKVFIIVVLELFVINSAVYAEESAHVERINMSFHSSKYIDLGKKISTIWCGSKIVFFHQPTDSMNEFVITAQNTKGSTTIFVWTSDGERYEYLINVTDEEIGQAEIIERAINLPNVRVKKVGDRILLTGTVKNQYERNLAVQTARLFVGSGSGSSLNFGSNTNPTLSTQSSNENSSNTTLTNTDKVEEGGSVIDLLQMTEPAQIRLEAQIISIHPQDTNNLGILWDGTGSGTVANPGIFYAGENQSAGDFRNNPFKWLMNSRTNLNFRLSALITQNKAKILSRPSIMTLSGEQATIQIGGEIPYTVINSTTGISSTNFKSYGIILQFKPIIDAENHLVTTVHTEVSNMSGETVNGLPIINTRRADAVVNLESGSTMIIGGLMDSSESKVVTKIPLLSKIPILGEFFKYTSKSKDKQELVILVTPYIVGTDETSYAAMSNDLRDYYHAGQREHNALNDVDLNALPSPFEDEKTKKDKKQKKAEKSKKDKKDRISEEEPTPNESETAEDDNNDDSEKHSNTNVGVEVFGDNF